MKRFISFQLFFMTISIQLTNATNLYKEIAEENLKSFKNELITKKSDSLNNLISRDKKFSDVLYEKLNELLNPAQKTKQETLFSLLAEYENKHFFEEKNTLDQLTWQDLNLLCGSASNPQIYLAHLLDRTSTGLGRTMLYRKLVEPQSNYKILTNQQNIIKELVNNETLFNELDKELKQIGSLENSFLSFWHDEFFASLFKKNGSPFIPFENKWERLKKINRWLSTNVLINEANDKISMLQTVIMSSAAIGGGLALTASGLSYFSTHPHAQKIQDASKKFGLGGLAVLSLSGALSYAFQFFYKSRFAASAADITSGAISSAVAYSLADNIKVSFGLNYCLQMRLMHVTRYLDAIQKMITHLQSSSVSNHIARVNNYAQKLEELKSQSHDLEKLLALLNTKTFTKEKPSYFSMWGRIIVAYRLMMELKDQFIEAMLVAGEIDAHISIARLYKEFQHKNITFCFPSYCQNETPSITVKDCWNPFLASEKVISNSLIIGNNQPRNIIITGPNAGGKSTTVKGLILAIILAQSFGIAPAQELSFTPFSKIITYLNITDDIAAGNSHFKSETKRARDLIMTAQSVNENQFSLMAADEIFNGTTYQEGQAAAYSLIELLGNYKNNICISCTHFPQLTLLEKNNKNFMNYKVSVTYDQTGKIVYPYKLEKGIAHQIVTFDILKEEGFGDEFLDRAKKLLKIENKGETS